MIIGITGGIPSSELISTLDCIGMAVRENRLDIQGVYDRHDKF